MDAHQIRQQIADAVRAVIPTHPTVARRRNQTASLTARSTSTGHPWGQLQVYGGTVPPHVKARRRAANKAARLSRRANR